MDSADEVLFSGRGLGFGLIAGGNFLGISGVGGR